MAAFEERAVEESQRCGPRHSATTREANTLTKSDLAILRKAEPAILDFLEKKPENAALFAFNPIAALKLVGKPLDRALLAKLQMLADASNKKTDRLPNVRIGRMVAKVDRSKQGTPGLKEPIDSKSVE